MSLLRTELWAYQQDFRPSPQLSIFDMPSLHLGSIKHFSRNFRESKEVPDKFQMSVYFTQIDTNRFSIVSPPQRGEVLLHGKSGPSRRASKDLFFGKKTSFLLGKRCGIRRSLPLHELFLVIVSNLSDFRREHAIDQHKARGNELDRIGV